MKNRSEVVIDGIVHQMTEEQMGKCVVEITPEQLEGLRLEVAREKGEVEHVLYDDYDPIQRDDGRDVEKDINTVVALQERMAKGSKMQDLCSKEISKNKWAGLIVNAWKGVYDDDKNERVLSDPRNKTTVQWIKRRAKLKAHWNKLASQCQEVAKEEPSVWPKYFQLANGTEDEGYDPRAHKKDSPEIDNRMLTSDEGFFLGHQEEQEELFSYNR